jgi:cytochrome c
MRVNANACRREYLRFMKWVAAVILALCGQAAVAGEPPPSLTRYRCYICHSDREPLVGPAFADVAKSYRGRRDAVDSIARDIRDGVRTGGPWHMPPHPEVSRQEARTMARYIMSIPPRPAKSVQEVKRSTATPAKESP